jgi:hypothetical protein
MVRIGFAKDVGMDVIKRRAANRAGLDTTTTESGRGAPSRAKTAGERKVAADDRSYSAEGHRVLAGHHKALAAKHASLANKKSGKR